MELCHREVVPFWWCIGRECRHEAHMVGSEDKLENRNCAHPNILKQMDKNKLTITGHPVKQMVMCPVLVPRIEI